MEEHLVDIRDALYVIVGASIVICMTLVFGIGEIIDLLKKK